jgi:hypothetical protein
MKKEIVKYATDDITTLIVTVRGKRVVLDMELARIYGVTTKVFNQAVKRNRRKFPPDFMFRLTVEEYEDLRSQFATSNRSQIVTGSQKHRNPRYENDDMPFVYASIYWSGGFMKKQGFAKGHTLYEV